MCFDHLNRGLCERASKGLICNYRHVPSHRFLTWGARGLVLCGIMTIMHSVPPDRLLSFREPLISGSLINLIYPIDFSTGAT